MIYPASGAGTDYQVKIIAHYGNGTDNGADVYLNGHCRNDFGDVRFASKIQVAEYYRIAVSSDVHNAYGLGYPVTYVFGIPQGSSNLKAYKRTGTGWEQLTEKTSNDFFNGIECVRFDYSKRKAYVSVAFAEDSDYIDVKITDQNGENIPSWFEKIAEYYDDRKCAVTVTADDMADDYLEAFMAACDVFQSKQVWLTLGIITSFTSNWTALQSQIDEGFIEVASHSRTHPHVPYDDYDSEIGGCKNEIIGNLSLPSPYRKGDTEYVWAWIEPSGDSDDTVRQKLGQYKYLISRSTETGILSFAAWDDANGIYSRAGVTAYAEAETLSSLNSAFDSAYGKNGIYHFYFHPWNFNWTENVVSLHLNYIKGKKDVWYVGFGALYAYHYVQKRGVVTVTPVNSEWTQVLLDYWMESKVDGDYAVFWVEVPNDLSSNPATIYIYYGKSDATTTSSLTDAFIRVIDGVQPLKLSLPMDEGSGTTAYDKSGNGNNGTLYNGASWTDGKYGKAVSFDGENDYVRVPADFLPTNAITVCLWIKAYDYSNTVWRKFINAGPWATAGIFGGQCRLTEDLWSIGLTWDNKGVFQEVVVGGFVNVWKFVAIGWDGTNVYSGVNGAWSFIGNGGTSPDWSGRPLTLGANYATGENFKGIIDEVRIYNRALTSNEISDLYNYYPFESASLPRQTIIRKRVDPEPSHGSWEGEETSNSVIIDQTFVSDERADVRSVQIIGFHVKWNNGSDLAGGSIYINNTEYITNSTGWVALNVNSTHVGKDVWVITGVNCNGVTTYMQTAPAPSIIWDQIKIIEKGITKESLTLGETATIWFKAIYEYDGIIFTSANGILYLNGSAMTWSDANTRWEYTYTATTVGTATFTISGVYDEFHRLTAINDTIGSQTINVWSTPFSIISNSTISELTFNSASKTLAFTVSGPSGTVGYTNVTITKTLIENISELKIYLDGNQIGYITASTEYTWLIHINYQHSTHKVVMILSSLYTNSLYTLLFKASIILSGIIIVIIAAIMLFHKKFA